MSYYAEPDSHFRGYIKIVLDLPNYGTKNELEDAICYLIYSLKWSCSWQTRH